MIKCPPLWARLSAGIPDRTRQPKTKPSTHLIKRLLLIEFLISLPFYLSKFEPSAEMSLSRRSIVERIAAEIAFEFLANIPFQHTQNCGPLLGFQLRPFAFNEKSMMATIPRPRRFDHFGKIVRAR